MKMHDRVIGNVLQGDTELDDRELKSPRCVKLTPCRIRESMFTAGGSLESLGAGLKWE